LVKAVLLAVSPLPMETAASTIPKIVTDDGAEAALTTARAARANAVSFCQEFPQGVDDISTVTPLIE
jgi:hypothetical protein